MDKPINRASLRLPPPATEPPPPPPPSGGYRWQDQLHTAALNNLAEAVRELAQAIRTGLEPPRSDS